MFFFYLILNKKNRYDVYDAEIGSLNELSNQLRLSLNHFFMNLLIKYKCGTVAVMLIILLPGKLAKIFEQEYKSNWRV